MKRTLLLITFILLVIGLTACNGEPSSEAKRTNVIEQLDFYITYNNIVNDTYDSSLDDVEESLLYRKEDFFNYDDKDTMNVDLEYDDVYESFTQLVFIKDVINQIDNFDYEIFFEEVITNESILIEKVENGFVIDYYEKIDELDVIMRHNYILETINEEVFMEKYTEIYEIDSEDTILMKRVIVEKDEKVTTLEYYPTTSSFLYMINDYPNQEFFMYKGTMIDEETYVRQTIEYYIEEENAFVSFDIKEDELEDYRIKFFDEGHRVLKIDINVKNSNPTVNELTWNMLSIDGWDVLEKQSDDFYLYFGSTSLMTEYSFDVQLNGYGKITAYIEFEGELAAEDISLSSYGLESGYTLEQVNRVRQHYVDNYESVLNSYGFILNEPFNRFRVFDLVLDDLTQTYFNTYIDTIE